METPETQIINVGAIRNSRQANQLRSSHFQKASPQWGRSVRGLFCKWNQKPAVLNYFKIVPLIFIYLYSKCLGDPPSYTVFKLVIWPALSIIKVVIKAGEEIIWDFSFLLSVNKYFLSIYFMLGIVLGPDSFFSLLGWVWEWHREIRKLQCNMITFTEHLLMVKYKIWKHLNQDLT